MMEST